MDDGVLLGTIEQLTAAISCITSMCLQRGVSVNLSKCRIWGPAAKTPGQSSLDGHLRHIPVVPWCPGSGLLVLGIPVTHPEGAEFGEQAWEKRVSKTLHTIEILGHLPQSHIQYTLLRFCLSACKVNDLLRALQRWVDNHANDSALGSARD